MNLFGGDDKLHCNSERRIHQTLNRLAQDPICLETFLVKYANRLSLDLKIDAIQLKPIWSRFLEFSALDPYTRENVQASHRGQESSWRQDWVEAVVEVCRHHDSEFNLALEESMTDRFYLAVALMESEEVFPSLKPS